jgi:hypothetical protein
VKSSKPEIKNYMDQNTKMEAQQKGVDPALLAYAKQKTDKVDQYDMQRSRTKDEKIGCSSRARGSLTRKNRKGLVRYG